MSALSQTENENKFIELIKSFYMYIRSQEDGDLLAVNKLFLYDNIVERTKILFSNDSSVLHTNIRIIVPHSETIVLDPNVIVDKFHEVLGNNLHLYIVLISKLQNALSNLDKRIKKLQKDYKSEQDPTKKQEIKDEVRANIKKKIVEQKKFEKKSNRRDFLHKLYNESLKLIEIFEQEAEKYESLKEKEAENICPACEDTIEEEDSDSYRYCPLCGYILKNGRIEITHYVDLIETNVLKLLTNKPDIKDNKYEKELIKNLKKFENILIIILHTKFTWLVSDYMIDHEKKTALSLRFEDISSRIRKNIIYTNKEDLNIHNKILLEIHNYLVYIQTTVFPGEDDILDRDKLILDPNYSAKDRLDGYNIAGRLNKFDESFSAAQKSAQDAMSSLLKEEAAAEALKKKQKKKKKKKNKKSRKKTDTLESEEVTASSAAAAPSSLVSSDDEIPPSKNFVVSSVSDAVTVSEQKSSSKPVRYQNSLSDVIKRIVELHEYITEKRPIESEIIEWFGGSNMNPSKARFQYHKAKKEEEIEVSRDYLDYALSYINMLQEKLKEKGYMLVVVGGYATKLYSKKAKKERSKSKWFKKNYNTQDIDLKLCRVRENDEEKTINQMREILDETIIENSEQWPALLGLYDPTNILQRDRHGTIEKKEISDVAAEERVNPNIPLKITAPIATSFKKGGSPIEPIVEITFSNTELPEDMEEIDELPIPSARVLIEGLMFSSMNFIDRLEIGERNLYIGKLVSWYWQLRYLVRYIDESLYQSIHSSVSSSPGMEMMESAGRKGGRRKTKKKLKKKKKTTTRKR